MNQTCWFWCHKHFSLTARTLFPFFSMEQGHQPLTDCWTNRDLAWSAFSGLPNSAPSIMSREHFSGVFAGATIWRRSSSNVPAQQYHNETFRNCVDKKEKCKQTVTLTEVIVQGEFVVIPYLHSQSRRNPELCFVKVPEVLLKDNIAQTLVKNDQCLSIKMAKKLVQKSFTFLDTRQSCSAGRKSNSKTNLQLKLPSPSRER